MKKRLLFLIFFLLSASIACSTGGINFQDGGLQVNITITEEQINRGEAQFSAGDLFSGNYQVDLQPGKAVITGTMVRPNGKEITGNVAVGISAENGALQVTILEVSAEGISIQDESLQRVQDAISQALSQAFNEQQFVTVDSVTITEDAIVITLRGELPTGQ
jgi:hypothetical protein